MSNFLADGGTMIRSSNFQPSISSILLLIISLLTFGLQTFPTFANEKSLTIAFQGPLSGEDAQIGRSALDGVKYAVHHFNNRFDGQFNVLIQEVDDQGDPARAEKVAPSIASNSSIIGLVGPSYSAATIASLPFYKIQNLPLISPSAIRLSLTDPQQGSLGFPIFHRVVATDKVQGPALYRIATEGVSSPKVFVVDDQSAYAALLSQFIRSGASTQVIVGTDSVPENTADWASTIAKVKNSGANVVIYTGYFPQAATLFTQLRNSGFTGILAGGDGVLSPSILQLASRSVLEGVRMSAGTVPLADISRDLESDFRTVTGSSSGAYAAESIDATNVLLFCIATGSTTRSQMLNCIDRFSGTSVYGHQFSFDFNGDNTTPTIYGFEIKSGSIQLRNRDSQRSRESDEIVESFPWYGLAEDRPSEDPWSEYKSSPTDTSNGRVTTSAYDIVSVDFAMSKSEPDYYFFWLVFAQPVKANLFSDNSSWAGILLDANNDGKVDFSVETNLTKAYSGNYYHDGRFVDRRTSELGDVPSCNAQTWTNLDKSVSWIGFRFKKNCVTLSKTFSVQGYSDRSSNDNTDYDYAPENLWAITPGVSSGTNSASTSSLSSSNLLRSELAEFTVGSSLSSISSPASPPKDLVALTPKVSPSVVTVLCSEGTGTGWSIDARLTSSMLNSGYKSLIITNHHVIENCISGKQVTLVLPSQQRVSGLLWAWSESDDTAGILTSASIPVLQWRGATPQQGWWVGVIGSPLGFPGVLTTGIVSSVNTTKRTLTTTAPLNPGNSGGPVFDREGRVVGLATAVYRDSEGFGIVHGTPLLCNKILNCSDVNQVWVSDLSLIRSSSEEQASIDARAKAEADALAKAKVEAEAKAKEEAEAKARAEAEIKLKDELRNKCVKFNGDRDLALFAARNSAIVYPGSATAFDAIIQIAPPAIDCQGINVVSFEAELLARQKLLTTFEIAVNEAKAAAISKANQSRTITCVKGKLTRKITAVNPKCPKGYKRK
jgi:branched-chain amino acid transport system substrate-binding protein